MSDPFRFLDLVEREAKDDDERLQKVIEKAAEDRAAIAARLEQIQASRALLLEVAGKADDSHVTQNPPIQQGEVNRSKCDGKYERSLKLGHVPFQMVGDWKGCGQVILWGTYKGKAAPYNEDGTLHRCGK